MCMVFGRKLSIIMHLYISPLSLSFSPSSSPCLSVFVSLPLSASLFSILILLSHFSLFLSLFSPLLSIFLFPPLCVCPSLSLPPYASLSFSNFLYFSSLLTVSPPSVLLLLFFYISLFLSLPPSSPFLSLLYIYCSLS